EASAIDSPSSSNALTTAVAYGVSYRSASRPASRCPSGAQTTARLACRAMRRATAETPIRIWFLDGMFHSSDGGSDLGEDSLLVRRTLARRSIGDRSRFPQRNAMGFQQDAAPADDPRRFANRSSVPERAESGTGNSISSPRSPDDA